MQDVRQRTRFGRLGSTRAICALLAALLFAPIWAAAQVTHDLKLDHFGYRPNDDKVVIATADPGSTVEIRRLSGQTVYTIPTDGGSISFQGFDSRHSGDNVWWIDFGRFQAVGDYVVHSPVLGTSYPFSIREGVYEDAAAAALKTYYYQRCNVAKPAAFAGDWNDPAPCHMSDVATGPAAGHTDHGPLDLTGGWHDAGDYNKYVWSGVSDAIQPLLAAYEDHPNVFLDDTLEIPESGNGIPDLLDEIKVETDWLLKMQLPDGSVLYQMHVDGFASSSPPSEDTEIRYYQDPNLLSGSVFTGSVAQASRVFASVGMDNYAETLLDAAKRTWAWLETQGDSDDKVWAAAELYRTDPSMTAARAYVDGYTNWAEQWFEIDAYEWRAAATYLQTPSATESTKADMRVRFDAHVDFIFGWDDPYRAGMADWQYYWGSNRPRALYGLFLLTAAELGSTGSRTATECRKHALDFLHWMHGRNTLNMLYLTNMDRYGGEHSSYQLYHAWLGDWWDIDSRETFIGKPAGIDEPDYPYFKGVDNFGVSDDKVSVLGPAPGFVPGGPNHSYPQSYTGATPPAGEVYPDRAYRDWCDQSDWTAQTWEITENSISYQGAYAALASYFVRPGGLRFEWRVGQQTGAQPAGGSASTDGDPVDLEPSSEEKGPGSDERAHGVRRFKKGGVDLVELVVESEVGAEDLDRD